MLYSEPPGCDAAPRSPVFMSKKRAVRAFLMEMSMLPSQAPSMRRKGLEIPPGIDDRNVHQGIDLSCLLLCRIDQGLRLRQGDVTH